MFAHVLTKRPVPPELLRVRLYEKYHCGPLELARIPLSIILEDLATWSAEDEALAIKNRTRS